MNLPGHDAWRLAAPDDECSIGEEEGQPCNRFPEPDEDQPRGYKPTRCDGTMVFYVGYIVCDVCGEQAT